MYIPTLLKEEGGGEGKVNEGRRRIAKSRDGKIRERERKRAKVRAR